MGVVVWQVAKALVPLAAGAGILAASPADWWWLAAAVAVLVFRFFAAAAGGVGRFSAAGGVWAVAAVAVWFPNPTPVPLRAPLARPEWVGVAAVGVAAVVWWSVVWATRPQRTSTDPAPAVGPVPDDGPDAGLAVDVATAPGLPARACAAVATAFKDAWAVVWDPTPKPASPPPPPEPRTIIATRILPSLEDHSYRAYDAGPALTVEEAPREETAAAAVDDVVGRVVAAWDGAAAVMHMDELADRMGVDQTVLADLLERAGAPVDRKARKKRGGVSTPKMGMRREDVERWRNGFSTSGAPLG